MLFRSDNLKSAIDGERYENTIMYPDFAKTAKKEGLDNIADRFSAIAIAEKHHQERYERLLENVKSDTSFKKDKKVFWICRECGYIHFGTEAPEKCPSCDHPQSFYQINCEEY